MKEFVFKIPELVQGEIGNKERIEINEKMDELVPDMQIIGILKVKFELIRLDKSILVKLIKGGFEIKNQCVKCLTEFKSKIKMKTTEREYFLKKGAKYLGETDDLYLKREREIFNVDLGDNKIDLTEFIRQEMYLNQPEITICREKCKGLCSVCGQNLNEKTCDCERTACAENKPFKDLKKKIQESN